MTLTVGVVDYGMGNLHSVAKAFALQNARVLVSDDQKRLKDVQILVVPGVGSFGAAMTSLRAKGLDVFIRQWVEAERPYVGICLGYQLLFKTSEESPGIEGLDIIPGRVVRFQLKDLKKGSEQIPHMGWNVVDLKRKETSYFKGIKPKARFYFVHTYYPVPNYKNVVLSTTPYGKSFSSSIAKGNLFASQFHPEKSGEEGLKLISNIVEAYR